MNQKDIDRLVEIVRVEDPNIHSEINALKKKLDALRQERETIEKKMIIKLSKESEIQVWEATNGVLAQARYREKSVTLLDKSTPE